MKNLQCPWHKSHTNFERGRYSASKFTEYSGHLKWHLEQTVNSPTRNDDVIKRLTMKYKNSIYKLVVSGIAAFLFEN